MVFHLLFGAQSGFGKSYHAQAYIEANIDEFDCVVVADYSDEFRGLVKAGYAKHWVADQRTLDLFERQHWQDMMARNPAVILARHGLDEGDWQDLATGLIPAARAWDGSVLLVFDEAHFVAPQSGGVPDAITALPTSGRSEKTDSVWITQKLQKLEDDVISQCTSYLLGGFRNRNDRNKFAGDIEYPPEVHRPGGHRLDVEFPQALQVDGQNLSVRKWETDDGAAITGSEWIYSDDNGTLERRNTSDLEMDSPHIGAEGKPIKHPSYG